MQKQSMALFLVMMLSAGAILAGPHAQPMPAASNLAADAAHPDFGNLPLAFEPNVGQSDVQVRYLAHSSAGMLFFTPGGIALSLRAPAIDSAPTPGGLAAHPGARQGMSALVPMHMVQIRFVDATPAAAMTGDELLPGRVNYYIGSDPAGWHTEIPTYARVTYTSLYPGIDLAYAGGGGQLKGTFAIAPGADPERIRWRYEGTSSVSVDEAGNLVISLAAPDGAVFGNLTEQAPVAWQDRGGQRALVAARYAMDADGSISLALGVYDTGLPLVVDPTLVYSTYLGAVVADYGEDVAVDANGSAYVTGFTLSACFPLQSPFQGTFAGGYDAFVTKFSPSGQALVYSTYLGGVGQDQGLAIAVDTAGSAYVTGATSSTDFPLQTPFQGTAPGGSDAFVTKFSSSGQALVYSTYLGGAAQDQGQGIAVDAAGGAYVTGYTRSANFPLQTPFQAVPGGGYGPDAFVTKFGPSGQTLAYSTYLGGVDSDSGEDIAVDAAGSAYVTGSTAATNFPLQNPFQATHAGGLYDYDAFVTKFSPSGQALVYSTYLGGTGSDTGTGITVDGSGSAHVTGHTAALDFPRQNPIQATYGGGDFDVFVTEFNPSGQTLAYSTYLGGTGSDSGTDAAVDAIGNTYVTGYTSSTNFPLQSPIQTSNGGGNYDAFVTKLGPGGQTMLFSTYLGGAGQDQGRGIAVDAASSAYVAGSTGSANFPLQAPFQGANAGSNDAFVTKIAASFQPDPDGYNFVNHGNLLPPSWGTFRQTYANSQVEYPNGVPKPAAVGFWLGNYWTTFRSGLCYGMSTTSLAYFEGTTPRPGGATTTYALSSAAAWPFIELYHGRQLSQGFVTYAANLWRNNPGVDATYTQLKQALPVIGGMDPYVLVFVPGPGNSIPENQRFGHVVVPYRLEEQPGSWGKIYVYDPNFPGDAGRYFYFDFSGSPHSFQYDMGRPIPLGGNNNYIVRSLDGWVLLPVRVSQLESYDAKLLPDGVLGTLLGNGNVVLSNSLGQQLGYVQGVLVATIPGSAPLYQWINPNFSADSMGFSLPADTYQAQIASSGAYQYFAASITTTLALDLRAADQYAGTDIVQVGADDPSAVYTSTLPISRTLSFRLASDQPTIAREYGLLNGTLSGPGTLRTAAGVNGVLTVNATGMTSSFDLEIQGLDSSRPGWFLHRGVTMTASAAMTITAPHLAPSSIVTVTVGGAAPQTWVLNNQITRVVLPVILR